MTTLKLVHLRFDCMAMTPIKLGGHYAGNNLRNGLAKVIHHSVCSEPNRRGDPSPEHAANCPACWLLSAKLEPGSVVRAYALVPPMPLKFNLEEGDSFSFGLTLFGDGVRYFPYFVLALNQVGQVDGVGPGRREGNGRFQITTISAIDPLRGEHEGLHTQAEQFVKTPTLFVNHDAILHVSQLHLEQIKHELTIHFHTPMRLEEKKRVFKMPDFAVLFKRTLFRIDELSRQHASSERREKEQVFQLHQLANAVRLVEADTHWHEMWSHSSRKKGKTPLGGFTGTAVYWAEDWKPLFPWLMWGQATQTGKLTTKGNGVFELFGGEWPLYWDWMRSETDSVAL